MSIHSSLSVDFGDEEKECQYDIFVEVDKNPCKPNETVTIKIYGSNYIDLQYIKLFKEEQDLGLGIIKNVVESESENIVFDDSIFATTKYPIHSFNSAIAATSILKLNDKMIESLYTAGSQIFISKYGDSCVKLSDNSDKLYGSIDLDYNANKNYKEYRWKAPNIQSTITYPFFVLDKETEDSEYEVIDKLSITVEKSTRANIDVKFIIKDIANDRTIKDAQIIIDQEENEDFESLSGVSDDNGEVIFNLMQGETYQIYTIAEGYIDSDKDYINNDTFTVPTSDEA